MNQEAILEWLTQMFTTKDYLFNVSTTWQYMIIVPLALYLLTKIINVLFGSLYMGGAAGVLNIPIWLMIWFIEIVGTVYYLVVLIKYIMASVK